MVDAQVYLVIDTGGSQLTRLHEPLVCDKDWAPLWLEAGLDVRHWHGQTAFETTNPTRRALADMGKRRRKFEAMNREDYESCRDFLRDVLTEMERHPIATVAVEW